MGTEVTELGGRSRSFRLDFTSGNDVRCSEKMPDGETMLPFVLQFYGHPSTHLWEDEEGVVHEIPQGEGGEQGDPLMPALFALGQHQALEAIQESLQLSETLMAFLDDVHVTTPPDRTAKVEQSVEVSLWSHARIQVNQGGAGRGSQIAPLVLQNGRHTQ